MHNEILKAEQSGLVISVHNSCRRKFTDKRSLDKNIRSSSSTPTKRLRSSSGHFDWKNTCFLCNKAVSTHNIIRDEIHEVATIPVQESFLQMAEKRQDEWGSEVLAKLLSCIDLVAAEAVYHRKCRDRFAYAGREAICGRPTDEVKLESFESLCQWFIMNSDNELYSIQELHDKMRDLSTVSSGVYSVKTFREKLKERYSDYIYFVQGSGRNNEIVCFKNMTDFYLRNLKKNDKNSVIEIATKIIKDDI